jgi:Diacylglycerol kinase catalytic domain
MSEILFQPERVLVVANPNSSHFERVNELYDQLDTSPRWRDNYEALHTKNPKEHDNAQRIINLVKPGDVVWAAVGDGTLKTVVEALMSLDPDTRNTIALVPDRKGNANDASHRLYGRRMPKVDNLMASHRVSLEDVMRVEVHEDAFLAENAHVEHGFSYVDLGFMALAAELIDDSAHRDLKRKHPHLPSMALDGIPTTRALKYAEPFKVEEMHDDASIRVLMQRVYSISPRMAKGVVKFDVRNRDGEMIKVDFEDENFALRAMRRLAFERRHGLAGERLMEDAFTVHDSVVAEIDGEPIHLAAGSLVRVKCLPKQVGVLLPKAA